MDFVSGVQCRRALRGFFRVAPERHVRAIADDITRSARIPDVSRSFCHETARAAVRPLPSVRSTFWLDAAYLVVMVGDAQRRSMDMIDQVCLALEPLGDTLATVVNVQDVTAGRWTAQQHCRATVSCRKGRRRCCSKQKKDLLMQVFDDRDTPYLEWLNQHPDGYVLNRRRGSSIEYLILHRAGCGRIRNYSQMARPGGFTGRGYVKVCSESLELLHQYARTKGGRPDGSFSGRCSSCSP